MKSTLRLGVLLLVVLLPAWAAATPFVNLLANPGLETGNWEGWSISYPCSMGDWWGSPHSGSYAAICGQLNGEGHMWQTLPTVTGQSYHVNLWFYTGDESSILTLTFANIKLFDGTLPNSADTWVQMSFLVMAPTNNSVFDIGTENDPSYFMWDDAEVLAPAVPEPATVLLLGSGLLGVVRRRMKARK